MCVLLSRDGGGGGKNGHEETRRTDGLPSPPCFTTKDNRASRRRVPHVLSRRRVPLQHNLEYFGEGEYMMFDNNFNSTESGGSYNFVGDGQSRLLIVKVDEEASIATLEWEVKLKRTSN